MSQIKLLLALALLVVVAIFTVVAPPNLSNIPPMIVLVVSLFIGAVFSAVLGIAENLKLTKEIKKQKKEIGGLNEKIEKLQLKIREFEEKEEEAKEVNSD
ncbi:MAG: DUF1049 domain-containing protein [Elusimicrobia bacterium]|nr:DUF1049 domain-containing protein [Elusimicrobiota bacterium]